MNAPHKLNPLICDTLADTAHLAACALKYLARAAEDRADHERLVERHVACGLDPLTADQALGNHLLLQCIAAALDHATGQTDEEGEK